MDPFVNSYPYDLPILSDIEEIVISKVFVVMRVYRLKGSNSVGYKGNVLNIEQYLNDQVKNVCNLLPRLPTEIPYFIIRKYSSNVLGFKDFKINLNNIHRWPIWLQDNNLLYKKCVGEERRNYYHRLSNMDGYDDLSHVLNSSKDDFSDVEDPDIEDSFVNDDVLNGPEQGGATSNFDSNIEEGHLYMRHTAVTQFILP